MVASTLQQPTRGGSMSLMTDSKRDRFVFVGPVLDYFFFPLLIWQLTDWTTGTTFVRLPVHPRVGV